MDLPPEIVDKYFLANVHTDRFLVLTAQAICGHCAVKAECLLDALTMPDTVHGVRGGESGRSILLMRRQIAHGNVEPADLVLGALSRQADPLEQLQYSETVRKGLFKTVQLARPDLGGAAPPSYGGTRRGRQEAAYPEVAGLKTRRPMAQPRVPRV
jgi:hypothetical protein